MWTHNSQTLILAIYYHTMLHKRQDSAAHACTAGCSLSGLAVFYQSKAHELASFSQFSPSLQGRAKTSAGACSCRIHGGSFTNCYAELCVDVMCFCHNSSGCRRLGTECRLQPMCACRTQCVDSFPARSAWKCNLQSTGLAWQASPAATPQACFSKRQ